MKVKINFKLINNLELIKTKVKVLNKNNKIIYNNYTNKFGKIIICCKKNEIYKILILGQIFIIYTSRIEFNIYIKQIKIIPLKKIILTDKIYIGLPIEKGIIYLWQKQ